MAEIITGPSPAFVAQQQQQPDLVGQYSRLLQLKNQAALAPLQLQQAQQGVQQGQLDLQNTQQAQKDNAAFRAAMADPSNQGKSIGEVADLLAGKGALSGQGYQQWKKLDVEQRQAVATLNDTQLKAAQAAHAQTQQLYNNVMNMDDATLAQNWPAIAQQYDQIPGNNKVPLNPNQPLTKEQLKQFAPMISMQEGYLASEAEKRKTAAEVQAKELENKYYQTHGGAPGVSQTDSDKFTNNWIQTQGLPDTPQNRLKGQQEYIKQTKIVPAQVRVEGMGQMREMPVMDTQNGNALQYLSAADINAANKTQPGRYIPAVEGAKALSKTATIEDIRGNIQAVRQNLQNPKMPEFTAQQRAQIAVALGNEHAQDALSSAFRGGVLGSLTPEQQDFLINMAQLKENAMAMRSVLGAGQGSQDLRDAITATLPGPRNPSKAFGLNQLTKFESVLDRLEKGIPKVPLAQGGGQAKPNSNNDPLGIR